MGAALGEERAQSSTNHFEILFLPSRGVAATGSGRGRGEEGQHERARYISVRHPFLLLSSSTLTTGSKRAPAH